MGQLVQGAARLASLEVSYQVPWVAFLVASLGAGCLEVAFQGPWVDKGVDSGGHSLELAGHQLGEGHASGAYHKGEEGRGIQAS